MFCPSKNFGFAEITLIFNDIVNKTINYFVTSAVFAVR